MRITDTDARSYQKKEFAKVLEQHEKEKKDKYLQNCLEMRIFPSDLVCDLLLFREKLLVLVLNTLTLSFPTLLVFY